LTLKVIDLFCGVGGFSLGFEVLDEFEVIYAVDNDPKPLETYRHNFPDTEVVEEDVKNIDEVPDADVVIGGPPCPNFSLANKKRDPKKGMELIYEYLRLKDTANPDYWIMENVPQVTNHIARRDFPKYRVYNCANYGVPQKRKRCFAGEYPRPEQTHAEQPQRTLDGRELKPWVTVWEAIWDLILTPTKEELELNEEQEERVREFRGDDFPNNLDEPSRTVKVDGRGGDKTNDTIYIPIPNHNPELGASLEEWEEKEGKYGTQNPLELDKSSPTIKAQEIARNKRFPHHFLIVSDHEGTEAELRGDGTQGDEVLDSEQPSKTIRAEHHGNIQAVEVPDHIGRKSPPNFSDTMWEKHPPQELDEPSSVMSATLHKDQPHGYVKVNGEKIPWEEFEEKLKEPALTIESSNPYLTKGERKRDEDGNAVLTPVGERRLRRLTVRECARLQSFPDWFEFRGSKTSKYRQIGNAVPPLMAYRFAEAIRDGRHG